jgi:hypothetical protein
MAANPVFSVLLSVVVSVAIAVCISSDWKRTLRLCLQAAVASVFAFYFFRGTRFSDGQAIYLALLVGGIAVAISFLYERTKPPQFERFWIRIQPNWTPLPKDYGLVDEDSWDTLRSARLGDHGLVDEDGGESRPKDTPLRWNLLRDGIGFTVLAPDLYYSNDHKSFFSKLDFVADIEELRPTEKPPWPFHDFVPRFYVKERFIMEERREYLEFGLITLESIQRPGGHEFDRESKLVPAARLPKEFLRAKRGPAYHTDLSGRKAADLEKQLSKSGWQRAKRESEDSFLGVPFEIQHKYVTLRFDGLR